MKQAKFALILLLLCISLVQKLEAANRFWVASSASNWNNIANWSNNSGGAGGFSVPGLGDNATFNILGLGSCSIDIAVSVSNITIALGYTGTLVQGSNTLLITNNASFSSGTFTGGSANMTIGNNFTLAGTNFTSTTGILELDGNGIFTSPTFSNNNGTVRFNASGGTTISGTSPAFYILEFVGNGFSYNLTSAGNITVSNSLNLTGSLLYNLNTGTINVTGDINISNTAPGCGGTALININGAAVQNLIGASTAGQGALPQLTINKPSGLLNLSNFPASSNTFTYTAGVINAGTSTYCFVDGTPGTYTISGSLSLNNISFLAITNATFNITGATTLTANGDFSMFGTNRITLNTGDINVNGNILLTNTSGAGGGSATINILGTGNQTMDGSALAISQNILPFIIINKPSGTLTLKGNISVSQDWTYSSGTVDASSFTSTVAFGGNSLNLTSSGMSFYNLSVTANTISLINNVTLNNNLSITAGHLAPGSNSVSLSGNWNDYGAAGLTEATSTINFIGSSLQTITVPGGENFNNLNINNSGVGIQLKNNATVSTQLTMTNGNIDLNGNTMTLGTGPGAGNIGTLNYLSGTMINTGTFTRWFAKATIASLSAAGQFPLGSTTNYRPLYISAPVAPTTGGTISLSYADITGNTMVSFPDGTFTVAVIKNLNWTLATANGLAGGNYSLDAQGTGLGTIGNVADLRVTLSGSVVGVAGANAGTISDPQVNRTGLSAANLNNSFFIGSVNYSSSDLPLTLMSFTASLAQEKVALQWETGFETNTDYFSIQRSTDGVSWNAFDEIQGKGPGDSASYYTAYDFSPYSGISYYRIVQIDPQGNQSFSEVKSVDLKTQLSTVNIYPNPATDHITIGSTASDLLGVMLFNSAGQQIKVPISKNGNSQVLSVGMLSTGVYLIRIDHTHFSETRKIEIRK